MHEETPDPGSVPPSVDNVLGFSLEFRQRRAMLRLERRLLRPGALLTEYLAEIPGITFPVEHPIRVDRFRSRRCRVESLTLRFDLRHIEQWLRPLVVGFRFGTMMVETIELVSGARARFHGVELWCHLSGRHDDGRRCEVLFGLALGAVGRRLAISAPRRWVFGDLPGELGALWGQLVHRFTPPSARTGVDAIILDPAAAVVVPGFVRAGWKAPDTTDAVVRAAEIDESAVRLVFEREAAALRPVASAPAPDPVAAALDEIRTKLAGEEIGGAIEAWQRSNETLGGFRTARLAAARWMARALRHRTPTEATASVRIEALRTWLRHEPDSPVARRWLVEALGSAGRFEALARLTQTERTATLDPRRRARLDLASGLLLLDHLGDRTRARSVLGPWVSELERSPELTQLRVPIRTALARAQVDTPRAAVRTLEEALAEVDDPTARAQARLHLARDLIDVGAPAQAIALLREALVDDPVHPDLEEVARRLAVGLDEPAAEGSEPSTGSARTVLALAAVRRQDDDALVLVDAALEDDAPPPELLRAAAALAANRGDLPRAGDYLLRLRGVTEDPGLQARVRLARADVLIRLGQHAHVWAELGPALAREDLPERPTALRWAIEYGPARAAVRYADELGRLGATDPVIEALQARWTRWQQPDVAAQRLVDLLEAEGQFDRARSVCIDLAALTDRQAAVTWLTRAAARASPTLAAELLERALHQVGNDHDLEDLLERALRDAGALPRLRALWTRQAEDSSRPRSERLRALDQLLAFHIGDHDPVAAARDRPHIVELCRARHALDPAHGASNLVLADDARRRGDSVAATEHLAQALALLGLDDPRRVPPTLDLALSYLARDQVDEARDLLLGITALDVRGSAWSLLSKIARLQGDEALLAEALETSLRTAADPSAEARTRLELAGVHRRAERLDAAIAQLEAAAAVVETGSALHLEIAEAWLDATRSRPEDAQEQARARAGLRAALGPDLPVDELRAEAMLWARDLGEPQRGIELLELGLSTRPAHPQLLSALEELCTATGNHSTRYLDALRNAIASSDDGHRDALRLRMAAHAAKVQQPVVTLEALDQMSPSAAIASEALDLRDWAVRRLGRRGAELDDIERRLRQDPEDAAAMARLRRALPDPSDAADHLLRLAATFGPDASAILGNRAVELVRALEDPSAGLRLLRRALDHGLPLGRVLPDATSVLRSALSGAIAGRSEALVIDLLSLPVDAGTGPALAEAIEEGLDDALGRMPPTTALLGLLWTRCLAAAGGDTTRAEDGALARIATLVRRNDLTGAGQAELFTGLAERLSPPRAIELLLDQAASSIDDARAFDVYVRALQRRGRLPELLRIVEERLANTFHDADRVVLLARLASLYADAAADPERAADARRRGLELSPDAPEFLLPLLEHHFERHELPEAVQMARRVLERVTMGTAAYVTLAHRAADAALALGEPTTSLALLRLAATRSPEDARTKNRLAEVEAMRGDPQERIRLLSIVADRQYGPSRLEALEEKARLLADPLGRVDEAISTLELLLSEAPDHDSAIARLVELYEAGNRWHAVCRLLESVAPRQHGPTRCQTLRRLARVYREHLFDAPRSEHALRVALDHLGDDPEAVDLAETLRAELVSDLESQGRYVDLAIYLERALSPELEGAEEPEAAVHPMRVELLIRLARIYRGPLDDHAKAARVYARLERLHQLPDEGLATLARAFHRDGRHADLVRILRVRANALAAQGEHIRKAAVDVRIAELLEGPLGRPHEAARHYLDAYLADPGTNEMAGTRARVLLSGTDAVVNVRAELLRRRTDTPDGARAALSTLLGDVLGPHDEYEEEAEAAYRDALRIQPDHGPAQEALGRLLVRQGKLDAAVEALTAAARNPAVDPARAAEAAAVAARALRELGRLDEAEPLLRDAVDRAPDSQRALLELARLHQRRGRDADEAIVLEQLSQLPIPSPLAAEVSFRRASLLMPAVRNDAYCPEAERARVYLLEAISSDASHGEARAALLELARARLEWSVVAHMHYLTIRELPAGPTRARAHLDLAETHLDHLDDQDSAARNIESALQQAPEEVIVVTRAGQLATRLRDPRGVAERFETVAASAPDLEDATRARLWLLAAELRLLADDVDAAEAAFQRVFDLPDAPAVAVATARRNLEALAEDDDRDLRREKSGLLRLLDAESAPAERASLLGRLRDVALRLGDADLIEWSNNAQLELARELDADVEHLDAALSSFRTLLAERGAYDELVDLLERGARVTSEPARAAALLWEATEVAWNDLRSPSRAAEMLGLAMELDPMQVADPSLLDEIVRAIDDAALLERLHAALETIEAERRPAALDLSAALLALRLNRTREGLALLRPLARQGDDPGVRWRALRELHAIAMRTGTQAERLSALRSLFDEALERRSDDAFSLAEELIEGEMAAGDWDRALALCDRVDEALARSARLLPLRLKILERRGRWDEVAQVRETLALALSAPRARAEDLVEAARVWLEREGQDPDPARRVRAVSEARRVLMTACDTAPDLAAARAQLLPLEFWGRRWESVLRLGAELRDLGGDADPRLILPALTQALVHGQRSLARDVGGRHAEDALGRYLLPGLRHVLTEVATHGPLPRLDSVLAAAAALGGGRRSLHDRLREWAAGSSLQEGVALAMARLNEADGRAELARSLYQLVAFMVPDGPVPALVNRLPISRPPPELNADPGGPLGRGNVVRAALVAAREATEGAAVTLEAHAPESNPRLALADTILEPWRRHLGLYLPVSWDEGEAGLVRVRNTSPASIVLGPAARDLRLPELRFRLARATIGIAMGLAPVESEEATLVELLDALGRIATPGHEPTRPIAQVLADRISATNLHLSLDKGRREALVVELRYWLSARDLSPLQSELSRLQTWFATRLSGQLDGALSYLASELGLVLNTRGADPAATLHTDQAQWLLRGLALSSAR